MSHMHAEFHQMFSKGKHMHDSENIVSLRSRFAVEVRLIRFRGHLPKGGYDGQNGIKQARTTGTTTVHG